MQVCKNVLRLVYRFLFKTIHLYRLPFSAIVKVASCHIKEILRVDCCLEQKTLRRFFDILININGICRDNAQNQYLIRIPPTTRFICRKYPSSDVDVIAQIWQQRHFQGVVELLRKRKIGRESPIKIIDAGSYAGYSVIYFKRKFPHSKIIALEPEASNFSLLERNVTMNNVNDVILIRGGLWRKETDLEIGRDNRDRREWSYYVKEAHHVTGLKGYSITHLLAQYGWDNLDLLKIDIEGGERYIFEDTYRSKDILAKVKFIAMEIHDEFDIRKRIYHILKESNYDVFESGELTIGENKNRF